MTSIKAPIKAPPQCMRHAIHNIMPVKMSGSQDSNSGSEPITPSKPPSEDHVMSEDDSPKLRQPAPSKQSPDLQTYYGTPYVQLNEDYDRRLDWSNDPSQLYLASYFDPNEPNLARDFQVDGLCPVVKEDDSDRFILRDAKNRYYLWDAYDRELLRVREIWTKDKGSTEQVVEYLLSYLTWVEEDTDIIYGDREED